MEKNKKIKWEQNKTSEVDHLIDDGNLMTKHAEYMRKYNNKNKEDIRLKKKEKNKLKSIIRSERNERQKKMDPIELLKLVGYYEEDKDR